jgi:hypothetical protein
VNHRETALDLNFCFRPSSKKCSNDPLLGLGSAEEVVEDREQSDRMNCDCCNWPRSEKHLKNKYTFEVNIWVHTHYFPLLKRVLAGTEQRNRDSEPSLMKSG